MTDGSTSVADHTTWLGLPNAEIFGVEGQLFPVRLMTREMPPVGAHIAICARADDGGFYFCKDDRSGLPIRMREGVFSQLAHAVGLPTPGFSVIEDPDTGETFFGSKRAPSTADNQTRLRFLRTESKDELGRYLSFPGSFFSQLFAFDMFLANDDLSADNIIALRNGTRFTLCPIDFAAAEPAKKSVDHFPVVSTETVQVARQLRMFHGHVDSAAIGMIKKLEAIDGGQIGSFFKSLPVEWIDVVEREELCDFWASERRHQRLARLQAGLENGSLF